MKQFLHLPRIFPVFLSIPIIAIILVSCSFSSGTSSSSVPTATSIATIAATHTAVPAGVTCQQVFSSGTANPTLGTAFSDVTIPAASYGTNLSKIGGGGDGQFTISSLSLCTPDSSTADVHQYFDASLTSNGWFRSNTFPSDGSYEAACAAGTYCFAKDTRYISLQSIQDNSSLSDYTMLVAVAPAAPTCPNGPFLNGYYYKVTAYYYPAGSTTPVNFDVPLPPLTLEQPDDATGGQKGYNLCSAGSASMVAAFIHTRLTAANWTQTSSSGANQSWTSPDGKLVVNFIFTSGQSWTIYWRAGFSGN